MDASGFVERVVGAVERRDADAFAALFAEDAVAHHPPSPEPTRDRDAIRESEQALFGSFSDVHVEVHSVLACERQVSIEVVLHARNTGPLALGEGVQLPATHRTVDVAATRWYDLGPDGQVVEARDYFDSASLMTQLGVGNTA